MSDTNVNYKLAPNVPNLVKELESLQSRNRELRDLVERLQYRDCHGKLICGECLMEPKIKCEPYCRVKKALNENK